MKTETTAAVNGASFGGSVFDRLTPRGMRDAATRSAAEAAGLARERDGVLIATPDTPPVPPGWFTVQRILIAGRVKEARLDAHLSQGFVATRTGIPKPCMSIAENPARVHERQFSAAEVVMMAEDFRVRPGWLLSGVGPRRHPEAPESPESPDFTRPLINSTNAVQRAKADVRRIRRDIARRFAQARDLARLSQGYLAARIGVSRPSVTKAENPDVGIDQGVKEFSAVEAVLWADECGVRYDWLLTGGGEIFRETENLG